MAGHCQSHHTHHSAALAGMGTNCIRPRRRVSAAFNHLHHLVTVTICSIIITYVRTRCTDSNSYENRRDVRPRTRRACGARNVSAITLHPIYDGRRCDLLFLHSEYFLPSRYLRYHFTLTIRFHRRARKKVQLCSHHGPLGFEPLMLWRLALHNT